MGGGFGGAVLGRGVSTKVQTLLAVMMRDLHWTTGWGGGYDISHMTYAWGGRGEEL